MVGVQSEEKRYTPLMTKQTKQVDKTALENKAFVAEIFRDLAPQGDKEQLPSTAGCQRNTNERTRGRGELPRSGVFQTRQEFYEKALSAGSPGI